MFSVQKRDFIGQWVELYRANMFLDAKRFKETVESGPARIDARLVRI